MENTPRPAPFNTQIGTGLSGHMTFASIRVRLTVWYLSVLVSALIILGAGTWIGLRHELHQALEKSLAASTSGLAQYLERESEGNDLAAVVMEAREYTSGMPDGQRLRVLKRPDGAVLLEFPSAGSVQGVLQKREDIVARGHPLTLELSSPVQPIDDILSKLRVVLLSCIPVAFVIAGVGGWWLSRTALQPVDRMTAMAESISLSDLSVRLTVPDTGDELQHLGNAWNKMLDRLGQSVEQMRRFTADAAHELRTPIAIIRSTAELGLRRERDSAGYRAALAGIGEEARNLSGLVADLLWLARNDAAQVTFNFETFDVTDLIRSVCRSVEPLAATDQTNLEVQIQNENECDIHGDPGAVRRVLVILMDNAIKFSRPGGQVKVRTARHDDYCIVEVQDFGAGIANEDLPHIFDRFYSSDRARNKSGFGLGLSIAQAVVEAHRGRIEVASVLGEGSCFRILLPATDGNSISGFSLIKVGRAE